MHASKRNKRDAAAAGAAVEQIFTEDQIPSASKNMIWRERLFKSLLVFYLLLSMAVLAVLVINVLQEGLGTLDMSFLTNFPSSFPKNAGIQSAITGTLWLMAICAFFVIPVGVAAAIYLEEFADRLRWWNRLIETQHSESRRCPVNRLRNPRARISRARTARPRSQCPRRRLTLGLLVLPVVVISSREALRAVPELDPRRSNGPRCDALAGDLAQVLPAAIPGIATGAILALSRAIGETAPLIMVGAATYIAFNPTGLDQSRTRRCRWSDLPMDLKPEGASSRFSPPRRSSSSWSCCADQLRRDLHPQPLREEW